MGWKLSLIVPRGEQRMLGGWISHWRSAWEKLTLKTSHKERQLGEEGLYTSYLCNKLILWAWSRKPRARRVCTMEVEDTIVETSSTTL